MHIGFRVQGLGFKVPGLLFRPEGLGFRHFEFRGLVFEEWGFRILAVEGLALGRSRIECKSTQPLTCTTT